MDYITKENYVAMYPDPRIWKAHANYHILMACADVIKGTIGDLGCNHGACTLLALEIGGENVKEVFGYDINMEALKVAYDLATHVDTDKQISFICANLTSLPCEDEKFDFLMSFHTLEHIYPKDANSVVAEMYRALKPGGHVLISIPYDHAYPDDHHVAFYTEESLQQLFERHGFHTISCFKDDRYEQKDLLTALFTKQVVV